MRNDNRNYNYNDYPSEKRMEYTLVADLIPTGSRVVDLACGNGALMEQLIATRQAVCEGIELSPSGVEVCQSKGLKVIEGRVDEKLPYADNQFDVAVCNVTIQMLMYPETLLSEMKRIAPRQVISFPNFAYFKNRLDLLLNGRMPKQLLFGYQWYNTGHIHQLSIRDFEELVAAVGGLEITTRSFVPMGMKPIDMLGGLFPGWFRKVVIMETRRTNG
ncbi:methionine biosynthesis protein MetW [Chitinophaga dinghuensis]|uniref:Methionine biosynthesis protein MetW n=1 Tax=Chitinophaga dinghuensis TaxID=1539050 RepID=A0A327VHB9_9BACT|nr:methionine biosynthesis protein MetW [Chitinophaga dinghuensis]RAJ73486.1 methionine biosynthesis protein MetW [Chitinophaga dinghuensis]